MERHVYPRTVISVSLHYKNPAQRCNCKSKPLMKNYFLYWESFGVFKGVLFKSRKSKKGKQHKKAKRKEAKRHTVVHDHGYIPFVEVTTRPSFLDEDLSPNTTYHRICTTSYKTGVNIKTGTDHSSAIIYLVFCLVFCGPLCVSLPLFFWLSYVVRNVDLEYTTGSSWVSSSDVHRQLWWYYCLLLLFK
jgi:hypothetical protein